MPEESHKNSHWKAWVVAALAALLWLPLVVEYFTSVQTRPYYKLWPLLAIAIVVMFTVRWRRAPEVEGHPPRLVVWGLFAVAISLLLFALLYYVPYAATLGWIVMMAVVALYISSFKRVENLLGLWLLLLLFMRPPYQVEIRVMTWMESLSVAIASRLLDYGGTIHIVQGSVISLPKYDFRLEAICSGWVSVVSMLACAAVICVARNRHFFHSIMLLLVSLMAAWLLNIVRILMVVKVKISYGIDLLEGHYLNFYHLISFLLGLALVLCSDSLVVFLYSRAKKDVMDSDMIRRAKSPLSRFWTTASSFELTRVLRYFTSSRPLRLQFKSFLFISLILVSTMGLEAVVKYHRGKVKRLEVMHKEDKLVKIGEESVVIERKGWEVASFEAVKRDFKSIFGALSSTWRLKYNGLIVTMSLDYPFHQWHDVKVCYGYAGWKMQSEQIIRKLPTFKWQVSETNMVLPNGDAGYILCSLTDQLGNPALPKPTEHDHTMLLYRIHPSKMTPPFGVSYDKERNTFYQTQCMVSTPLPLDEATKEEVQLMYADFREQIRSAIAAKSRQNPVN